MDKGDKESPASGRNIFENAANLMGMSPFGLSFGAHLAHMPSAYSLLQHHPAFPVSSLFGGLADGGFGHLPPSFTSAAGTSILPSPILSLDMSPSEAPLAISIPDPKSEPADNCSSTRSSPSKPSPKSSKSSSRSSKSSRSPSSKTTVPKASTTLATTSTVSTSSSSRRPTPTTMVSGTTGISLLSGKLKKSSKHLSSRTCPTSDIAQSTSRNTSATNGTVSTSASSSPLPTATSSSSAAAALSPSTKHKELFKAIENGTPSSESDNLFNGYMASPGFSSDEDEFTEENGRLGNDKDMDSTDEGGNGSIDGRNTGSPNIHIDGTKKRLIADQIRQRVQNKPIRNIKPSIMQPMKRGRGRPPKHPEPTPTPQQLEVIKEYKKQQEQLKRQLEESLRQQQMQLKVMKRAQVEKEKEASAKVQRLLEASVKQARANAEARDQEGSKHRTPVSPTSHQPEQTSSRSSGGKSSTPKIAQWHSDVHPSTSKGSPLKLKLVSEESSGLSDDNDSDSEMNESDEDDDSGINETDSDGEPRLKMAIDSENEKLDISEQSKKGEKRSAGSSPDKNDTPTKRPRVQMDERELKIPTSNGWRRQTTILAIGKRGFIGEVLYFAPCGKKMKTIPDVMRYIDRHAITGMGRENFSFNTKVNVGDFYETRHGHNGVVKLTNEEVVERMALVESKRQKMLRYKQQRGRKRMEKQNKQLQLAKQMMDQKIKRKMEQQGQQPTENVEMDRRAAEYKMQKRIEKDRQKDLANKVKQIKAMEQKKQKEELQMMRDHEKIQRQEQLRLEREMRAQHILESNLLWYHMEREREMKRQQAVMIKEQERERKRQHILLVKAMEAQKKQAERDRLKEEKVAEKRMVRERKMEQKRWEIQMARELKKPTEDMELRDTRPLPEFPRIPGIQIDSAAFADILMVLEFLHNFADALGYDKDTLPSLKALQDGILGKTEEDSEDYIALVSHLLRYAINDPGVPNPKEAVTLLGQKIVDMEITDSIVSEILRIFVVARNGGSNDMSELLSRLPLESLDHVRKAAILAFLCNELLCGKSISSEIEKHLDRMGDIRRDKWVVEGKLRRLRVVQAKKFHRPVPKPITDMDSSAQGGEGDESLNASIISKRCSDDDVDEEKEEESGNDSDDDVQSACQETDGDEDEPMSLDDCEKQIEKLQKQHAQYRAKVFKSSHKLRAIMVGSDRYRRKFWVLPCAGGVYVEGLETGKSVEDEDLVEENKEIKEENKVIKEESVKVEKEECEKINRNSVKTEENEKIKTLKCEELSQEKPVVKCERKENRNLWDIVKEEGLDKSASVTMTTKMEIDEDKSECKAETGEAAIVTSALFPTSWKMDMTLKHKPTTCNGEITPSTSVCNNKLNSASSLSSSTNLFLQSSASSHLSDPCTSVSSTISPTKDENKLDNSKLVVNSSLHTSPSPLITPYSSAPSLFFPPFSPSLNGALGSSAPPLSLSPRASSPRPAHQHPKSSTPSHTESKSSFLSIDTLLKKDHSPLTSQNNHFLHSPLFPVSPDQMIKTFGSSDGNDQKPWFSILPRLPCDDLSMTQGGSPQAGLTPNPFAGASPFFSPLSLRAFPLHSPSFSSFQMGQLFSSPNDYSATTSNNTTCDSPGKLDMSSFKVPLTPKMEPDPWMMMSQQQESADSILKELQGEMLPIPTDMKKSWWRVTDPEQLRTLARNCHPRGIREKNLQKSFQKYMDYASDSCSKGSKEIVSLESDSSEEEDEEEVDKKEEGETEEKKEEDNSEKKENAEEKPKKKKTKEEAPIPQKEWLPNVAHQVEQSVLMEVENLVERVASASLQVKGWKVPSRVADEVDMAIVERTKACLQENERYPLDAAREKLIGLEPNIERRYIKPPLTKAVTINLASLADMREHRGSERRDSHTQDDDDDDTSVDHDAPERQEDVPPGLATWRLAVAKANSPAQLTLCLHQLSNSISWEKSIMKVLCQICRKDDNEAQLLLCDGCDQGYHTYCFKPKMDTIPDGDWYCYECISKATGDPCCIVCGKKTGKIAECHHCPRAIHLDCLDPPLPRMPRKWVCPACTSNQNGRKRTRKSPKSPKKLDGGSTPIQRRDSDVSTKMVETPSSEKKRPNNKDNDKKKAAAEQSDDMTVCRLILTEMEKHEDGWPFLKPVNFKQFPTYKKFIKHPMDFSTMKNKLRDSVYKNRAEFAVDCKLIFENCRTFNEDESEVGKGGHTMRKFFESRWKDLLMSTNTPIISSSSSVSSSTVISSTTSSSSSSIVTESLSVSSPTTLVTSSTVVTPTSCQTSGTVSEETAEESH